MNTIPLTWFMVDIIATSVFYTRVFNHTRGSVFIATILHASNNTTAFFLPVVPQGPGDMRLFFITITLRWLVAIAIVAWFGSRWLAHEPEPEAVVVEE